MTSFETFSVADPTCVNPYPLREATDEELGFAAEAAGRAEAGALADVDARLGADVGHYSFTMVDLHQLLLAGLPAPTIRMVMPGSAGGRA